jgi:putative membrane protein
MSETTNPAKEPETDPRLYMAAERTFLAWIRTGIGLMAFGFVVARFGVFLRQMLLLDENQAFTNGSGVSLWMGIGFIAAGVVVHAVAAVRHCSYVRALREGRFQQAFGSAFALSLAAALGVAGVAMAVFLLGI